MHNIQLQAGYFIEEILPSLEKGAVAAGGDKVQVQSLLHWLSWFEVHTTRDFELATPEYDHGSDAVSPHALWAVATNLLTRGLPTRAPLELAAAALAANWPGSGGLLTEPANRGSLLFGLGEKADMAGWNALLWRALHPLDPHLQRGEELSKQLKSWKLDSKAEADFVTTVLPNFTADYLPQLLDSQTSLVELLNWSHLENELLAKQESVSAGDFAKESAIDFTIALPYPVSLSAHDKRGIVLEVDGPQHKVPPQSLLDIARDNATEKIAWLPVRVPVDDNFALATEKLAPLKTMLAQPYFQQLQANYDHSLLATLEGKQALQLTLGPLAVARVQRVLLEVMQQESDPRIWRGDRPVKVAVVERDVVCGQLAVELLLLQLQRLYTLAEVEERLKLPQIELHIYHLAGFEQPDRLGGLLSSVEARAGQPQAADGYEVVLDVSMLQRPGFSAATELPGVQCLTIRTAHRPRTARRFRSAPLLAYPALVDYDPALENYKKTEPQQKRVEVLDAFVQDIFRKRGLRNGQLPIISRALQGKNVLGLLPTGGGKSLTYQLAALLQPGVALVIDPIKSLMQDQVEGLMRNWIDAGTFLSSSVSNRAAKTLRMERLLAGEVLFMFVAPERLVMQADFRDWLYRMRQATPRVGFSYCVIDEAHCVSEWGHSFRTPYLRLGANARAHCVPYQKGKEVILFGLTATASFDVLADVQRELALDGDEGAIIRTASMARPELHVEVRKVEGDALKGNDVKLAKHQLLEQVLKDVSTTLSSLDGVSSLKPMPEDTKEPEALNKWQESAFFQQADGGSYGQAGLIFSQTKPGVTATYELLTKPTASRPALAVGYFMGTDGDAGQGADTMKKEEAKKEVEKMAAWQTQFVNNELNMLVATKAFGMGIDKPNVRFTVHYGYPDSIESFVQEAGRAGRDRAVALNYILYHNSDWNILKYFFDNTFKPREQEVCVLHELLTLITFPSGDCSELNAELAQDKKLSGLKIKAYLSGMAAGAPPKYLSLSGENEGSYGWIDLGKLPNVQGEIARNGKLAGTPAQCWAVVNSVVSYLLKLDKAKRTDAAALATTLSKGSVAGILSHWAAGGGSSEFSIGFRNGTLSKISSEAKQAGFDISENQLRKLLKGASSATQFARAIDEAAPITLPKWFLTSVAEQFPHIRQEPETFRAIHRLCLLRVLEDYTVDYAKGTVQLKLAAPMSAAELEEAYCDYLARYTTPDNAKQQAREVMQQAQGTSPLEKFLDALLTFNEETIKVRRLLGISEMEGVCLMGLKDTERGEVSNFIDLYLNSKYARQEFLPNDTVNGTDFSASVIWKYLGCMYNPPEAELGSEVWKNALGYMRNPPKGGGKERDNIKHLRGACARLLRDKPNNGAFLLLGAFSTLYLELTKESRDKQIPELIKSAEQQLYAGFIAFYERQKMSLAELLDFVQKFADEAGSYHEPIRAAILTTVKEPLELELHVRWLEDFNKRFIDLPHAQPAA